VSFFTQNPNALAAVAGGGAFLVVVLVWSALMDKDPLTARMKNVASYRSQLRNEEQKKKMTRRISLQRSARLKNLVQKLKLEQGRKLDELRIQLSQAGYRSRDAIFKYLLAKLFMPVVFLFGSFLIIFVFHLVTFKPMINLVCVLGSAVFGLMLPDLYIKNQGQQRITVLRKSMPDALDLLVICAEAGLSLDAALDRVSREMGPTCPELSEEIGLTGVELGFFPDRAKALQNLAERVPLPGVLALSNTLIQTEKYGTPLAQALRVLSGEMREDRIMAAEAKAAKLPATLTVPMILFILPPLFVILIGPAILKVMATGGKF